MSIQLKTSGKRFRASDFIVAALTVAVVAPYTAGAQSKTSATSDSTSATAGSRSPYSRSSSRYNSSSRYANPRTGSTESSFKNIRGVQATPQGSRYGGSRFGRTVPGAFQSQSGPSIVPGGSYSGYERVGGPVSTSGSEHDTVGRGPPSAVAAPPQGDNDDSESGRGGPSVVGVGGSAPDPSEERFRMLDTRVGQLEQQIRILRKQLGDLQTAGNLSTGRSAAGVRE